MNVISNLFPIHHQAQTKVQSIKTFLGKKTNTCWLENNTKVLSNDQADINNQKSRKYEEENQMSYLERFSSLLALMAGTEGRIQ